MILIILFMSNSLFAQEVDDSSAGIESMLKYSNFVENAFEGQQKVTDDDYNKALEELKAKQNKKKRVKKMKGNDFNQENSGSYIDETAEKTIILQVPLELINGDGSEIPIGHYKIVATKEGKDIFLDFYQASSLIAKVPAIETNNDFGEDGINFVKLMPYNNDRIKVIFGSMDFNAYTFIKIKKPIVD